ncbi:MAG TPA: cyanophycin synthetase, partial [Candidatus Ozemobacteraceae bacterium]|nr:cyanophycin synthetase [Candidatus Ozemobacteraceae bacterium]
LAKAEMLELMPESGFAVLPGDDPFLPTLKSRSRAQVVTFGFGTGCDLRGVDVRMGPDGIDLVVEQRLRRFPLHLQLLGKHNALNALAALALFASCGHDLEEGVAAMAEFRPVAARMESHEIEGMRIILDCYNANPSSMKLALEYLAICRGRRVAVLGDMRELGSVSEDLHREIGRHVCRQKLDVLVAVGDQAQFIAEAAIQEGMDAPCVHCCRDTDEAAAALRLVLRQEDTVLLKASRGMYFEKIVKQLWPSLHIDLH